MNLSNYSTSRFPTSRHHAPPPRQSCILAVLLSARSSRLQLPSILHPFHSKYVVTRLCHAFLNSFSLFAVCVMYIQLGGKSPVIVDKTADLKLAARRVLWAKMVNAGQVSSDFCAVCSSYYCFPQPST
jgi:hypothetical protein